MQQLSGVLLRLVIVSITVLPLAPSAGDMDLPGRGEQEAPTDQPTRRPPPEGTEMPADSAPEPTDQPTDPQPEPDDSTEADALDPFGADAPESDEGAGPLATILVWVSVAVAISGLIWLGWRRMRR